MLVSSAAGSAANCGLLAARPMTTTLAYELPNILLVPRAASAGELCCGFCWRCWRCWCCWCCWLLGNCPGETAVVPTPTMVARTGQPSAKKHNIGIWSSQHTLLVPRTSSARELCCGLCWRCWLYLPLGNCPGETAVGPPRTMVARTGHTSYELTAGSACSFGSSTCRWANIQASLPLDHPTQWSRGPGNLELLAYGWRCWLLARC